MGGEVNERGQGPGGGISTSPGGAGHGGSGLRASQILETRRWKNHQPTRRKWRGWLVVTYSGGSGGALSIDANDSLTIDTSIPALGGSGDGGSAGDPEEQSGFLQIIYRSLMIPSWMFSGVLGVPGRIFLSGRKTLENFGSVIY